VQGQRLQAMAQSIEQARRRRSRRGSIPKDDAASTSGSGRSPKPGFVIGGKYQVEGLLGQGGMGAVYRATHAVSGKRVAVKWMLPAAGASEELAERFVREARATARIDHPNVVDVYDVGTQDGSVYLVMELLYGESLAERLDRGSLEQTEAVALLMPALRAVAAAHAQGVIHRDLKPDNIFLCEGPDGEPREPKVLDFGISKIAAGSDLRDMSLTQSGTVMGTPFYMSPEQVRGLRDVDERGDVYAIGVILYEMLTGVCPFDGETYNELILKIVTEEPTPLASLNPAVDPILTAVISRAMARNRDDRHPNIAALAADLEPFGGGVTFRASSSVSGNVAARNSRPLSQGQGARSVTASGGAAIARSNRGLLALLAAIGLVALGAGIWWSYSRGAEPSPEHVVAPKPLHPLEVRAPSPEPAVAPAAPEPAQQARQAEPAQQAPSPSGPAAQQPAAAASPQGAESRSSPLRARRAAPERAATTATAATPTKPNAAPTRALAPDWDERLSTQQPARARGKQTGASPAGKLSPDDL
jgi:serine/threonine protein kinase